MFFHIDEEHNNKYIMHKIIFIDLCESDKVIDCTVRLKQAKCTNTDKSASFFILQLDSSLENDHFLFICVNKNLGFPELVNIRRSLVDLLGVFLKYAHFVGFKEIIDIPSQVPKQLPI